MKYTCIVCPLGCNIEVEEENGKITSISGHNCPRGEKFAKTEFHNPERMITTIVSLYGGEYSYLPVISDGQVPKRDLKDCMNLLKKTKVKAPVKIGDLIETNILGTGINIIAAKTAKMGER